MVDAEIAAAKLGLIQAALARIEATLPPSLEAFRADRTAMDVVTFNLFIALQECIALAAHVVADAGWTLPQSYGETMLVLGERNVLSRDLAERLRAAAGLRNLIAHQYGTLDFDRVHAFASDRRGDFDEFCRCVARMIASP